MRSLLIKDTTKEERMAIIEESVGGDAGGCARMQYGVSCTLYFGEGTSGEKRLRVYVTYEKDIYFCKKKHNYNARDNLGMH